MDNLAIIIPIYREPLALMKQAEKVFSKFNVYWVIHHHDFKTMENAKSVKGTANIIVCMSDSHKKADMVNYAVNAMDKKYISVFDIDNIPSDKFFDKCFEAIEEGYDLAFGVPYTHNTGRFLPDCKMIEEKQWNFSLKNMCQVYANGYAPIVGSGFVCLRDKFIKAGFSSDTVTEDADMTMQWTKLGYKVKLIDEMFTGETPTNLFNTLMQRARWYKGTLQSLFKHKDLREKNDMLFTVYAWTILSPILTFFICAKYLLLLLPIGLWVIPMLFLFLFQDFEYQHWCLRRNHGYLKRSESYKWIVLALIGLIVPFIAIFEYFFMPNVWHLTRKKGI